MVSLRAQPKCLPPPVRSSGGGIRAQGNVRPSLSLHPLLQGLSPHAVTLGVGGSTYNFRKTQACVSRAFVILQPRFLKSSSLFVHKYSVVFCEGARATGLIQTLLLLNPMCSCKHGRGGRAERRMQFTRWSESLFISFQILHVAPFPQGWVQHGQRVRLPMKCWSVFKEYPSIKESNFPAFPRSVFIL